VDICWPVPGQRFVWPDLVELEVERLGLADQVEGVVDLLPVEVLVGQ